MRRVADHRHGLALPSRSAAQEIVILAAAPLVRMAGLQQKARAQALQHPKPLLYEYLLGSEVLVAPVLDPGMDTVPVYLPGGDWTHLWTGVTRTARGWQSVAAPIGGQRCSFAAVRRWRAP